MTEDIVNSEMNVDVIGLPCSGLATLLAGIALRTDATTTGRIEELKKGLGKNNLVANHETLSGEGITLRQEGRSINLRVIADPQNAIQVLSKASQDYSSDRFLLIVANPFAIQSSADGKNAVRSLIDQANENWNDRVIVLSSIEACLGLKEKELQIPPSFDFTDRKKAADKLLSINSQATVNNELWEELLKVLEEVPNVGLLLSFHDIRSRIAVDANDVKDTLYRLINGRSRSWPNVMVDSGLSIVVGLLKDSVHLLASKPAINIPCPERWTANFDDDWVEAQLFRKLNEAYKKIKRTPPLPWYRKAGAVLLWPVVSVSICISVVSAILSVIVVIARQNTGSSYENFLFQWQETLNWFAVIVSCISLLLVVVFTVLVNSRSLSQRPDSKTQERIRSVSFLSQLTGIYSIEDSTRILIRREFLGSENGTQIPSRSWTLNLFGEYLIAFIAVAIAWLVAVFIG